MKGAIELIYLVAVLFGVTIAVGASLYISQQLFHGITNNTQISQCPNCIAAINKGSQAQSFIPNAIVLVFILMCFASVILAAFLDSSPVFLVFEFILIPIELLISFVFHDAFFAIANNSFIGTALAASPTIALLFQYMPVLVLFISAVVAIITFIR